MAINGFVGYYLEELLVSDKWQPLPSNLLAHGNLSRLVVVATTKPDHNGKSSCEKQQKSITHSFTLSWISYDVFNRLPNAITNAAGWA